MTEMNEMTATEWVISVRDALSRLAVFIERYPHNAISHRDLDDLADDLSHVLDLLRGKEAA